MSFGTKFRILREAKGMPRSGCDEVFSLMHGTVSNWENGYEEPEEELLPVIAGFFGVKIRDLMNGTPPCRLNAAFRETGKKCFPID